MTSHRAAWIVFGLAAVAMAIAARGNLVAILEALLICGWGWIAGRAIRRGMLRH